MARIRTIKPEAFTSESLAAVSLTAERTFFGLLTQADDRGRHRDNAAVITGLLWPLRAEHTPVHVEEDLTQLADAELICRYTGDDGKRYLHIVTWHQHQKINRPSGSRLPACPAHDTPEQHFTEFSVRTCRAVTEESTSPHREMGEPATPPSRNHNSPGQSGLSEDSPIPHGRLNEPSVTAHRPDLGPRTVDLGSIPSGGASAPAPAPSARQLIGEYVAACSSRPPSKVLSHLGREINQLLADGIDPSHIRAGLGRFHTKPMHLSVLASLVNEAMNARSRNGRGSPPAWRGGGYQAWTNPADPDTAYAEEL